MEYINEILNQLYRSSGIYLGEYRKNLIKKRIKERIKKLNIDPAAYPEYLKNDPAECKRLIHAILIKVTCFFRNPIVYEILAQSVIPSIIARKKNENISEIRIWSAGCATGEEAYSIAILIAEALKQEKEKWIPYIFATDISEDALKFAVSGLYKRESLFNTKLGIIDKYFIAGKDTYEISPVIRKMVRFSRDNLISDNRFAPADSVFGTFDLILCRNVLIYFSKDLQKKVLYKLYTTLNRNGYLILGSADSPDEFTQSRLIKVDNMNRIFRKKEG